MQYNFNLKLSAANKATAERKANALAKLGGQFDVKTLESLARKGKSFVNHPVYGPMIGKELGL